VVELFVQLCAKAGTAARARRPMRSLSVREGGMKEFMVMRSVTSTVDRKLLAVNIYFM
jgi:hypothetical protein